MSLLSLSNDPFKSIAQYLRIKEIAIMSLTNKKVKDIVQKAIYPIYFKLDNYNDTTISKQVYRQYICNFCELDAPLREVHMRNNLVLMVCNDCLKKETNECQHCRKIRHRFNMISGFVSSSLTRSQCSDDTKCAKDQYQNYTFNYQKKLQGKFDKNIILEGWPIKTFFTTKYTSIQNSYIFSLNLKLKEAKIIRSAENECEFLIGIAKLEQKNKLTVEHIINLCNRIMITKSKSVLAAIDHKLRT